MPPREVPARPPGADRPQHQERHQLAGTLLALVIATAYQKWQPRVFFLLALRLAIGWHFLVEGVEKVHPKMIFDPPWSPEMMSEDAKFALGF